MQEKNAVSIAYFEDPVRFADLLNGYVYQGKQMIAPKDVREIGATVARVQENRRTVPRLEAQVSTVDVAKEVSHKMQVTVIFLENQSHIHYAMPVRVMNAESMYYHKQWRQAAKKHREQKDLQGDEYLSEFAKKDKLKPVVTIVVYLGREPWDGPCSLKEMLDLRDCPPQLQELIPDYPIHLLEARRMEHLEYFHTDIRQVFGFLQRDQDMRKLKKYITEQNEAFSRLAEDAYNMISTFSYAQQLQGDREDDEKEGGEKMDLCKALKDWMEESRQEGIQDGIQKGILQEQANTQRERQRADRAEETNAQLRDELRKLKEQLANL